MGLTFRLKALYSNISLHTIEGTFKLDDVDHRVPDNLHGTVLRPLNDWKELEPELYSAKAAKYVGREHVIEERTKTFDCLWKDISFFQPVPPTILHCGCGKVADRFIRH